MIAEHIAWLDKMLGRGVYLTGYNKAMAWLLPDCTMVIFWATRGVFRVYHGCVWDAATFYAGELFRKHILNHCNRL